MFSTLLESRAAKSRSPGGMALSAALHVLVLFLAVKATLHATEPAAVVQRDVALVEVKTDGPRPRARQLHVIMPTEPRGFQALTARVNIPDVLPSIDLNRRPTNDLDLTGTGADGGRGNPGVSVPPDENRTYVDYQVERPAVPLPGTQVPRYPEILKAAGVEGDVLVSFVVDTAGRVDPQTLVILKTTHPLFDAAVRTALPGMRFLPAEVGGRNVRQLVQQSFVFHIVK